MEFSYFCFYLLFQLPMIGHLGGLVPGLWRFQVRLALHALWEPQTEHKNHQNPKVL